MELYFCWVGVDGHFLLVGRGRMGLVEVFFRSVGVSGHFLWVDGCV